PLWADLRRTRRSNPRSASTPGHPRDVVPVPSLGRVQGSPCGVRPLDDAMDRSPALPGSRLRGRVRPGRGGVERPPVRRQRRRLTAIAFVESARGLSLDDDTKGRDMHKVKHALAFAVVTTGLAGSLMLASSASAATVTHQILSPGPPE